MAPEHGEVVLVHGIVAEAPVAAVDGAVALTQTRGHEARLARARRFAPPAPGPGLGLEGAMARATEATPAGFPDPETAGLVARFGRA